MALILRSKLYFEGAVLLTSMFSLFACGQITDNSNDYCSINHLKAAEARIASVDKSIADGEGDIGILRGKRRIAYTTVGLYDKALEDVRYTTAQLHESGLTEGMLNETLSQPAEAQKLYDKAVANRIERNLNASDCLENRARLDIVLGRNNQVIGDTTTLLKGGFPSEYGGYLATKALALHREGKTAEAVECLDQAKKLAPSKALRPQLALVEAIIYRDQNLPEKALKTANLLYNLRPMRATDNYLSVEEPAILALRATVYASQNKPDQAIDDLRFRSQIQNLPFNGESPYLVVAKNLRKAGNKTASDAFVRFAIADLEQQKKALTALK